MSDDGFLHEYAPTSSDEEAPAPAPAPAAGDKKPRTPAQIKATEKGLAALAAKRAEAAAAKDAAAAEKKKGAAAAPKKAAGGAGAGAGAAAAPPKPAAPPAPAATESANPLAHSKDQRPQTDLLAMAEIVKREIELDRLRRQALKWKNRSKHASKKSKRDDDDADSDSDSSSSSSEDERPSRRLERRHKKPRNVLPDPRDKAAPPDFFDALMTRGGKFNPW